MNQNGLSSKKRVSFSVLSSMYVYNEDESTNDDAQHYAEHDYCRFKEDMITSACNIRASLSKIDNPDTSMANESLSNLYINSYKRVRDNAVDNGIPDEEILGLEHLVLDKESQRMSMFIRSSSSKMILDEQFYHQEEYGRSADPSILAKMIMPFSQLNSVIASSRANHIAKRLIGYLAA